MKQITIVTQANRPGTLADITERLAARNISILDIDATDDHAHGVVVLRAEPYGEALRALADGGYHAVGEEVLVVRIPDEAGALARLAARFREPQININAMRIVRRDGGWASVLISTEDNARAKEILADCLASS